MMKTYEQYTRYDEGDYIVMWSESKIGKIVNIVTEPSMNHIYDVETIIQNKPIVMGLVKSNIKRLATEEEIENYKFELETTKYNL